MLRVIIFAWEVFGLLALAMRIHKRPLKRSSRHDHEAGGSGGCTSYAEIESDFEDDDFTPRAYWSHQEGDRAQPRDEEVSQENS